MRRLLAIVVTLLAATGCAHHPPPTNVVRMATSSSRSPATLPTTQRAQPTVHIHLPGIGGYRGVDRGMLRGLREGGYTARVRAYDWTGNDAGLAALLATQRHKTEAAKVAQIIAEEFHADPDARIAVTTHSAGAGIMTWALEQLPPEIKIDTLVLIAPALSPTYDMSRAFAHVRGSVYVFYSPYDIPVLGVGTSMFGTVDGVKTDAAGKVGFVKPPNAADPAQYDKLAQIPYRSEWIKLGNIGDHIGGLSRPFAKAVLAPLLSRGELPGVVPATPPATPPQPLTIPPAPATAPLTMPAAAAG
jgi:hypothetical protein